MESVIHKVTQLNLLVCEKASELQGWEYMTLASREPATSFKYQAGPFKAQFAIQIKYNFLKKIFLKLCILSLNLKS